MPACAAAPSRITGVAGSIGVALGPIVAGGLASCAGWRIAVHACRAPDRRGRGWCCSRFHLAGRIVDRADDSVPQAHAATRADLTRAFAVLSLTMTATLMLYAAFGTALPKLVQLSGIAGTGAFRRRPDRRRHPVARRRRTVRRRTFRRPRYRQARLCDGLCRYLPSCFPLVAFSHGWGVAAAAVLVVFLFESIAPLETMLLARYTPAARRGTVFGIRYGLSAIGTPTGVWLVAHFYNANAHFLYLLIALAIASALASCAALLPSGGCAQPFRCASGIADHK